MRRLSGNQAARRCLDAFVLGGCCFPFGPECVLNVLTPTFRSLLGGECEPADDLLPRPPLDHSSHSVELLPGGGFQLRGALLVRFALSTATTLKLSS